MKISNVREMVRRLYRRPARKVTDDKRFMVQQMIFFWNVEVWRLEEKYNW